MSNVNEYMEGECQLPTNINAELALSEYNTTSNSELKYNDNINMGTIEFREITNLKNIKYLLSIDAEEFKNSFGIRDPKTKKKYTVADKKKMYYTYIEILNKIHDENEPIYKKYSQSNTCYRKYVKNKGVQQLPCDIRNFVCCDLYDYDMVNCHPTIFYALCKKEKLSSPCLGNYIKNRDMFLVEINKTKLELLQLFNIDNYKPTENHQLNHLIYEVSLNKKILVNKYNNLILPNNTTSKNPTSSKMCCILMYFENMLLERVIEKYKTIVSIPMYDGLMTTEMINIEDLNNLTKDFGIVWKNKPLLTSFEFDESVPLIQDNYYITKKRFEKELKFIDFPQCYKYINLEKNIVQTYPHKTNIEIAYKNWGLFVDPDNPLQKISFLDRYIKDPNRKNYNTFDFVPYLKENPCSNDIFNTFMGFYNKPLDDPNKDFEKWFIDDYLNKIFINSTIVDYILNFIAHLVQYPNINPAVAIVLKSYEGCGKDSLICFLESLIGAMYIEKAKGCEHFFGQYNSHVANKLVVCCNETSGTEGSKYENELKEQLTKDTLNIREKFVSSYTVGYYWRVFIFSNSDVPIQYSPTDRRYLVVKLSENLMGNTVFWNNFYKNIKDKTMMSRAFKYFMEKDIKDFHPRNSIPCTNEMKELATLRINPVFIYLYKLLQKYNFDENNEKQIDPINISSSIINKAGKNIATYIMDLQYYSKKTTGIMLSKKNDYITRKQICGIQTYTINDPKSLFDHLKRLDCKNYDENQLDFSILTEDMLSLKTEETENKNDPSDDDDECVDEKKSQASTTSL